MNYLEQSNISITGMLLLFSVEAGKSRPEIQKEDFFMFMRSFQGKVLKGDNSGNDIDNKAASELVKQQPLLCKLAAAFFFNEAQRELADTHPANALHILVSLCIPLCNPIREITGDTYYTDQLDLLLKKCR
jgi:hypothetical protein